MAADPSIAAIAFIASFASIAASSSVACVVLLAVDGVASFAVAVDLAVDLATGFVADFAVALDVTVLDVTAGLGEGWGDGTSSSAPSSTHLSVGQNPEAQLALHHCVKPGSPVMLVHDWGSAVAGAGEGCSGMGTLARPRGAAAPLNEHPIAVASMPSAALCKGTAHTHAKTCLIRPNRGRQQANLIPSKGIALQIRLYRYR